MPKDESFESSVDKASELEKNYDWLGAVKFYEKALSLVRKSDFLKIAKVQEKIGYAFYRAAMQAESREKFKERMQRAIETYEDARRAFEKMPDELKAARLFRCKAVAKYLGYWITSDPSEKRRLLDECLELEKNALSIFWKSRNMVEYGRTYNELSMVFFFRAWLEWDTQALKSLVERGLEWGEKAVAVLSELDDLAEMAKACFALATCFTLIGWHDTLGFRIVEPEEMDRNRLKAVKYLRKAVGLSEKVGDAFLSGLSHLWLGSNLGEKEERIRHHEKALECGKRTRDNFLIGAGLDLITFYTYWNAGATEDPNLRLRLTEDAMEFYDQAEHYCSIISFMSPKDGRLGQPSGRAEYYLNRAKFDETDPEKRLDLLEKAEKEGKRALKLAKDSDIPRVVGYGFWVLGKVLAERARMDPDPLEKRSRLEEALKCLEKSIERVEQLEPFHYWDLGIFLNYAAEIKAELADTEPDLDIKRRLLEEAVIGREECLKLVNKGMPYEEKFGATLAGVLAGLQYFQDGYATLLMRVYDLTNKPEYLRKAIGISQKAIESARKLDIFSLVAKSCWKIARAQGILGEHLQAAESFEQASESYTKAVEKIPQLKDSYQDYASYTQAWSEIERARHHHQKQEYGSAREHFEKAADLHKSLKQWNYLAPNYSAWAQVEKAEELSRKEESQEAIQAFKQAAELFKETKKSLHTGLNKIENPEEKTMATNLLKATDLRHEFCIGRIAIEEAKILDKKGDHYSSSQKYGSAAETFEQVAQALESEQDQKELKLILNLSRAWQKMMQAEAEASPTLYMRASEFFEEAKEFSPDEKARMLALGHSRFCKALEVGTKFADTRDVTLHAAAIQSLESAANYYMKAGFQNASEYTKATELLFDAYVYMDSAKKETDPEKKAKLCMMAEKVLQSSAGSFKKAEHPEKREQVLRLLDKVKEERELALSLSEVLHAPSTLSTTAAFTIPNPTYEDAVGLERFEHAHIQAHLTTSEEATLEEEFEIRLDLVNVGKEPALLVSVEGLVPPTFKITKAPPNYNMEDYTLDVKGKRLEPQKVESIRISAKATKTGVTSLCPQITYVDELGKFHTHKPEAVQNTVFPSTGFQFKTNNAQKAFEYLTKAFVQDYMKRRLTQEKSGWRSLMQIVKDARISKKSVYGTATRKGSAISELEGRGVVELRIFLEERGRGGKITKARIAYEKDMIKRSVDQQVMKKEEK